MAAGGDASAMRGRFDFVVGDVLLMGTDTAAAPKIEPRNSRVGPSHHRKGRRREGGDSARLMMHEEGGGSGDSCKRLSLDQELAESARSRASPMGLSSGSRQQLIARRGQQFDELQNRAGGHRGCDGSGYAGHAQCGAGFTGGFKHGGGALRILTWPQNTRRPRPEARRRWHWAQLSSTPRARLRVERLMAPSRPEGA